MKNRLNSSFKSVPLRIVGSFAVCLSASACSNTSNTVNSFFKSNQTDARLRTKAAREATLARLSKDANKPLAAQQQRVIAQNNGAFRPNAKTLLNRKSIATPTEFRKPVAVAEAKPEPMVVPIPKSVVKTPEPAKAVQVARIEPTPAPIVPKVAPTIPRAVVSNGKPLSKFRAKLANLASGNSRKPVTIVHIGDSHVASDSFSQGIRRALQAQYGDAGRGMVIPAGAFKYGFADQVKLTRRGPWRSDTALKNRKGAFGLSGVNVRSASSSATLTLTSKTGPFDYAEVVVATGPKQGAFVLSVGDVKKKFNARAAKSGSRKFRIDATGGTLKLNPAGGGATLVHNWSTGKNVAGIRYVNLGLIGATVGITKRFKMNLVANDIRALDPDLIVYGYGTNEGFNDNLNLKRYRKYAESYLDVLTAAAPNSDTVVIGAADGLRRKARGGKSCGGGWYIPKKMRPLRVTMKQMASDRKAGYWDWSAAMGGECSANKWASKGLAARDRVHLTSKGYRRSASAFAAWLAGSGSNVKVASNTN